LHGWSDRDETTGQLRRRSTVQYHSAINRPSSAPVNVVCEQHLPSSTRHLLLPHLPPSTSTAYSAHSLSDYSLLDYTVEDYPLWITFHLRRHGLTLPDYRCVRGRLTVWYNSITCPWPRLWTVLSHRHIFAWTVNVASCITFIHLFPFPDIYS